MIGLAGLLAIQLFSVFLAIDVPLKRAFWTTLLVVLSPPILIFGALFFTELVTALLCVFVFRVVAVERTASGPRVGACGCGNWPDGHRARAESRPRASADCCCDVERHRRTAISGSSRCSRRRPWSCLV